MGSRKLVRDVLLAKQQLQALHHYRQVAGRRPYLGSCAQEPLGLRQFSIFNEFSKRLKGEVKSNEDLQQSLKEFNEKVGGIKEDLRVRTKETSEKLYERVDGLWADAEATTKKVSANAKEKLSAATEEVKESLGLGKKESSGASISSSSFGDNPDHGDGGNRTAEGSQQASVFGRFRSAVSSVSPMVSSAFQKLKEAKVVDLARKGYDTVKDELTSSPASRRKRMQTAHSPSSGEEISLRKDVVIVPTKQSRLGKKWEAFKEKMRGHPVFKRVSGLSEPIVSKGQEIADDVRDRWETSDNPVVHKIQDLGDSVFGETSTALSFKEIRRRDPYFSLPDFVADVQEMVRSTLTAYLKGEVDELKETCCKEVIERCKGERAAYETQGMFFDSKILHISDVDVRETKMMGSSPIIIVAFQTQQIYCVRDRQGAITAGGEDTIQTVYYAWAMQLMDVEELGEGAIHPTWRLREMQQLNVQALI
ncbi:mitochondrial import inner membrane translocase subunit TIM44-2-like [Wolffia australiana]